MTARTAARFDSAALRSPVAELAEGVGRVEQPGVDEGRSPAHRGNRARGADKVLEKRLARRPDLPGKQIGRQRIGRLGAVEVGV